MSDTPRASADAPASIASAKVSSPTSPPPAVARSGSVSSLKEAKNSSNAPGVAEVVIPQDLLSKGNEPLPEDERVEKTAFNNGFQWTHFYNPMPPDRVHVYLVVHVGSLDEEDEEQGIAHLLEHVVFMGTEKWPHPEALEKMFQSWGLSWGGDSNATTSFKTTTYTLSVPITEDDFGNVEKIVGMAHQMAFKALLTKEAVEKERGIVLTEAQTRNNSGYRRMVEMHKAVHHDSPLRDRLPIGKEDLIAGFTSDQVRAFYKKWYVPGRMHLFTVGKISSEVIKPWVQASFGGEKGVPLPPRKSAADRSWLGPPPPMSPLLIYQRPLLSNFSLQLNWVKGMEKTSTKREFGVDMMDTLLGFVLSNRIGEMRTEEDPGFFDIGWGYTNVSEEESSMIEWSVYCAPKDWKRAVKIAWQEAVRLSKWPVHPGEMKRAIDAILDTHRIGVELAETMQSEDILDGLIDGSMTNSPWTSPKTDLELSSSFFPTVTVEKLRAWAEKRLAFVVNYPKVAPKKPAPGSPWKFGFLSIPTKATDADAPAVPEPPSGMNKSSDAPPVPPAPTGAGEDGEAFSVDPDELIAIAAEAVAKAVPPVPVIIPDFLVDPKKIEKAAKGARWASKPEKAHEPTGVYTGALENGISVCMKPTKFEKGLVSILLIARGGRVLTKSLRESEGMGLGMAMFLESGFGGHQWKVTTQWLAARSIEIAGSVRTEGVEMDMTVPVRHLEAALGALWSMLSDRRDRPDAEAAFTRSRRESKKGALDARRSLSAQCFIQLDELRTENKDHRFRSLPPEGYDELSQEECFESLLKVFRRDCMELHVVGDFDMSTMTEHVRKHFGSIELEAPYPPDAFSGPALDISYRKSPVRAETIVEDKEASGRMWIGIKWQGVPKWGPDPKWAGYPERARLLGLATTVLSNRLRTVIRTRNSLVYDVSFYVSFHQILRGGWYGTGIFVNEDKSEEALKLLLEVVNGFCRPAPKSGGGVGDWGNGIADDEWDETMKPILASIKTAQTSNGAWLDYMVGVMDPATPKTLDVVAGILPWYEKVTKAEVEAAAREYFDFSVPVISVSRAKASVKNN